MLRYVLALPYIALYCVAMDLPDFVNIEFGPSIDSDTIANENPACNDPKLSMVEQIMCLIRPNGLNSKPVGSDVYFTGSPQWKILKLTDFLDKEKNGYNITPRLGAHKFHNHILPWSKARNTCVEEGGHLAIINSNAEEEKLLQMLNNTNTEKAWLGVHDQFDEGDWITVLDESMESTGYSKWAKYAYSPNAQSNKQNCGMLIKGGGMDDFDCATLQPFFCEINL